MSASFVQLPSEILIDPDLTALDLRIYAICMDFGRKSKGFTQIGHQHLGRLVGKHPRTIAKSIKRLTELGYIKVERIGLNRNDRIRCQKTVRREKSDTKPTQHQETKPTAAPTTRDKSTKKRYKDRPIDLRVNQSEKPAKNPIKTPPFPHRSTQIVEAIKSHQPLTDRLTDQLSRTIRPAALNGFFKNMAVIEDDAASMTISVGHQVEWIEKQYSEILNRIANKQVNIVS